MLLRMAGLVKKPFLQRRAITNMGAIRMSVSLISNFNPSIHAFLTGSLPVMVVLKKNRKKTRRKITMKRYRNKTWTIT
jgi:hypothetical protein